MQIAIISDTHFGIKNGSDVFLNYQEKFFSEVFFPYCVKNGITQIIHMGDFYEHRKYINIKVLSRVRTFFIEKLREHNMTMDIFPGNHCVYYKSTNELNSLSESVSMFSDVINLYMEPTIKDYDGLKIGLLPWITTDNYHNSINFISTADAQILCAHLEIAGFEMMKGQPAAAHGMESNIFSRYDAVLTGHYHTKSTRDNIHYLGTQYELTWSDCNDPKYFHILDTKTRDLKQIRNPHSIFNRIFYKDNPKQKLPNLSGCYVKVIVTSKKDTSAFDSFMDRIQQQDPFELKIVESFDEFIGSSVDDDNISLEDTGSLLNSYIDAIDTELDKDRLKTVLHELFTEAQNSDAA